MHWLFLRGLAREQAHWLDFPGIFEGIVPEAKVHFLDLPGVGSENHRTSPKNISAIVDDLRSRWLVEREKLDGDFGLCGISLGAMVSLNWSYRFPDDWQRVVIMNTSARNLGRIWHRITPGGLKMLYRCLITDDIAAREDTVFDISSRMVEDRAALVASWVRIGTERPIKRQVALNQLFAATFFSAPDALIPPTLVLGGAADALVNMRCSRELARRLGAPFHAHPEAGHDLSVDVPEWVAEHVRDWIED